MEPTSQNAYSHLDLTAAGAHAFGVTAETFCNWRWQMKHQVTSLTDAAAILQLSEDEIRGFTDLNALFKTGITPYYLYLMAHLGPENPVRIQGLPVGQELVDRLGQKDPLDERGHSPVREVVHVYPDRVAFCVAQLCPVYCRYCFRKRRDDEVGLHFNRTIVERGIQYIAENPAIKDVLITGGDPFIASDQALENLLVQLRAIPHVEVIRFGTRTPVTLPYRITKELAQMLAQFHPLWVNTHFNCVEELTPEARMAAEILVNAGIPVGNQAVLLKGVNDSSEKMQALCRGLVRSRIRPYYVFHPHMVEGTEHLRTSVQRGLQIMKSLRGNLSGYAIPTYALDTPSGKVPLVESHLLGIDGNDLLMQDVRGAIWREPDAATESRVVPTTNFQVSRIGAHESPN
jgi:lysine 2,3-aminomutase